jgi:hypothetical protein
MRQELDEQLCREFPNLYKNRNGSMQETCMCWGFDCDSGWFQLIYDLSKKLEAEILKQPEEERQHYCASQVKEKYAGLRFYMNCSTDEMQKFIEEAEEKSEKTCEVCGAPGKVREHHMWYYCSCEDHEKGGLNERKW